MRRITVTASTIGQQNPSQVTLSGGYRYRGDPDWVPGDPRYRDTQPPPGTVPADLRGSTERKRERLDRFGAALADLGVTPRDASAKDVLEAGKRAGVGADTARGYRRELQDRQQQEAVAAAGEITAALRAQIASFSPEHAALVAEYERRQARRERQS